MSRVALIPWFYALASTLIGLLCVVILIQSDGSGVSALGLVALLIAPLAWLRLARPDITSPLLGAAWEILHIALLLAIAALLFA